jgi:hypothetical protein
MATLYLTCAIVGGTLLVGQLLLSLFGLGGHHEILGHDFHDLGGHEPHGASGHDHADNSHAAWLVQALTIRSVAAALTFFGLVGMFAREQWGEDPLTLVVAASAAVATLFLVSGLMRNLARLRAEGTVRIDRAVGKKGTVYLSIPAARAGVGKIQLNLQNRTVEYQAVTAQGELLPTGAKVIVVSVVSSDTVEVAPATDAETIVHA